MSPDFYSLLNGVRNNYRTFLLIAMADFQETNELIRTLAARRPFFRYVRSADSIQNALNIAVVISYARQFKKSWGFQHTDELTRAMVANFTKPQMQLHKQLIEARDKEFAHSDASAVDVVFYPSGLFTSSRRTVRQLLTRRQLAILIRMVSKIRGTLSRLESQLNAVDVCRLTPLRRRKSKA